MTIVEETKIRSYRNAAGALGIAPFIAGEIACSHGHEIPDPEIRNAVIDDSMERMAHRIFVAWVDKQIL